MSSSQPQGPFVIGERVGSSVWLAQDSRNGRNVALKVLTRQLPKDQAKRDALVREVRVAAALYHSFLVPILEIVPVGDNLAMVMEVVDGQPISKVLGGRAMERDAFFRLAHQLAAAAKYLHSKGILHGNIAGDSVLVTPEGQLRLAGLNITNLLRRDRTSMAYQQKGSDARAVAYMAPEQIATQLLDERTDVFSIGVVLYEMATGRLPFPGATAGEIARSVVEGQPGSPKAANPEIDSGVLNLLGSCLFKDSFRRQKDAKAVLDTIDKLDPSAAQFAAQLEKKVVAPASTPSEVRRSLLLVADVADHEELNAGDPEAAARASSRMQQILGESVYLFDGRVVDPFGTRLVAEMPNIESALEAARKGEFDVTGEDGLAVRMLLHAGELEERDGTAAGAGVEKALGALQHLTPNTLFISEDFAREARTAVRLRDAGAKGGLKLFTIVPADPIAAMPEPTTAEIEAELLADAEAEAQAAALAAARGRKRTMVALASAAALVVVLLSAAGLLWMRRGNEPSPVAAEAVAPAAVERPTSAKPARVFIAPLTVDASDPALSAEANAIRLGVIAVLRSHADVSVERAPGPGVMSYSATLRAGTAGPEIVPSAGSKQAAPVAAADPAAGIQRIVQWVLAESGAQQRAYVTASALNSLAEAAVARSTNDAAATDTALRAAMEADPRLLPAHLMAMEFYAGGGEEEKAVAAARQVIALDPQNLDAARRVARASLIAGELRQSLALFDLVLKREPKDAEALNHFARYAASSGDKVRFQSMLGRLKVLSPARVAAHEPDMLLAEGRIDTAVQRYYTIEESMPDNPVLALKIGRLAVLRHSLPIAELEREKLARMDPLYGHRMLKAYIAAEKGEKAEALKELEAALAASVPGDDAWTCAAEVHAILSDTDRVIESLRKAAARKEPTASYVLASPLFRYLENEERFQDVRAMFTGQQTEIRTAFAALN